MELYRYWKALTTAGGQAVQYSDDETVKLFMMANAPVFELASLVLQGQALTTWVKAQPGFGVLVELLQQDRGIDSGVPGQPVIAAGEQVNVTGHSLGGHLALLFARMFPSRADQVVTLNAPTLFSQGDSFLTTMGFPPVSGANITRLDADGDGVHLLGNVDLGTAINIAQENLPGLLAPLVQNHSSVNGVDGMNLMALLSRLDSRFVSDAAGLSTFVRAASNAPASTYEKLLDSLRNLLLGPSQTATPTSSGASDAKRADLYNNMDALAKSGTLTLLEGKVRIDISSADLRAKARNDFSALASLISLSPIVLTGLDSTLDSKLRSVWGTAYTNWEADKSMSQADRDNGNETYTQAYFDDRAAMVGWLVKRNQSDVADGSPVSGPVAQSIHFKDYASQLEFDVGAPGNQRQVFFGGPIPETRWRGAG